MRRLGRRKKYRDIYFQLSQPTLSAAIYTSLLQQAGGAPVIVPATEGTAPLWRFAAASYRYAAAAASLWPWLDAVGAVRAGRHR